MSTTSPPLTAQAPWITRARRTLAGVERSRAILVVVVVVFAINVLHNAWVGDDAFITLRTVDNAARGHGLTWNISERVQAYTHPLWMFLLLAAHLVTREHYFTTVAVGFLVSTAAVLLLSCRVAPTRAGAVVAVGALALSRGFVDYATSGLENPMTHLLLAGFLITWARPRGGPKRVFWLSLFTSLLATNRVDTVLLVAPALLVELARERSWRVLGALLAGLAPFLAWEAFALVYYGVLVPNTAYAKLQTGVPRRWLLEQGSVYLLDSARRDPAALFTVLAGALATLTTRRWRDLPLASGMLVYLGYTVWIGGDFMSGRFITAPSFLGAALVARALGESTLGARETLERLAVLVMVALPGNLTGWLDRRTRLDKDAYIERGIADERLYYWPVHGISVALSGEGASRKKLPPPTDLARRVFLRGDIGFGGLAAGPDAHVVDVLALSDPLLARLPSHASFRIGHYGRVMPHGYLETLETGRNAFADEKLGALHERLVVVTQGPLFTLERWREIWRFNTGAHRHLVDRAFYRSPPMPDVPAAAMAVARRGGTRWDAPGHLPLYRSGGRILFEDLQRSKSAETGLACNSAYLFQLWTAAGFVTEKKVEVRRCHARTIVATRVDFPEEAAKGWQTVVVKPLDETGQTSISHFRPL